MSRRIQNMKRILPFDEKNEAGRRKRRLPAVVLKGYLSNNDHTDCQLEGVGQEETHVNDEQDDVMKCSDCGKCFSKLLDLYQHYKDEHPRGLEDEQDIQEDQVREDEIDNDANDGDVSPVSGNDIGEQNMRSPGGTRIRTTWCDICKKHLATVSSRNLHMRIHTGERPFVCPFCNKAFTQNVHLRSHMSVHTGAKPYVCEVCGKGFVAGRTLKIHMMSHTRESPHTCRWCSRKFLLRNHLLLHIQTHHNNSDQTPDTVTYSPLPLPTTKRQSPDNVGTPPNAIGSRRNSKMKYHLQPPQRVLVCNAASSDGIFEQGESTNGHFSRGYDRQDEDGMKSESGEYCQEESMEANNSKSLQREWQPSSNIPIKTESHEGDSDQSITTNSHRSIIDSDPGRKNRFIANSLPTKIVSTLRNSKNKESKDKDSMVQQKQSQQPCPNCAIVNSELQLLKTELNVIKQFLGSKLTLMEQKIDNIQVLIN